MAVELVEAGGLEPLSARRTEPCIVVAVGVVLVVTLAMAETELEALRQRPGLVVPLVEAAGIQVPLPLLVFLRIDITMVM